MANKEFKIQSSSLSLNGVNIDTSANGKLVIPGITRASTSVAIEVNDFEDQTVSWMVPPTVIDGYQYAVLSGQLSGQVGWTAATYVVDALDGEGYIDGITVATGGAGYTGEAVTYSQTMWATDVVNPINNFNAGDWVEIPFAVRCGAGEVQSEFGSGGGGGLVQRTVNFPNGAEGDVKGTMALTPDNSVYVCIADYTAPAQNTFEVQTAEDFNTSQNGHQYLSFEFAVSEYPDIDAILTNTTSTTEWTVEAEIDGIGSTGPWAVYSIAQGTASSGDFNGEPVWYIQVVDPGNVQTSYPAGTTFILNYTQSADRPIWEQVSTGNGGGLGNLFVMGDILLSNNSAAYINLDGNGGNNILALGTNDGAHVKLSTDGGGTNFEFVADGGSGSIKFPDGTTQTTAYTGQSGGGTTAAKLYITANTDGNITTSTDGVTWTEAFNTGINIGTVAIGPGLIIYTRSDVNGDNSDTGMYSTTSPSLQPALITGTDTIPGPGYLHWNQVQYFEGITYPWIAVGWVSGGGDDKPVIGISANGTTWSIILPNAGLVSQYSGAGLRFTDVAYNSGTWLVSATYSGPGGGGLWTFTGLTPASEIDVSNRVSSTALEHNFKAVEYFTPGGWNRWNAFSENTGWYATSNADPSVSGAWGQYGGGDDDISITIQQATNLTGQTLEEATSGTVNGVNFWMTSSSAGHIVWWPDAPEGPYVSLPAPYTSPINDIIRNQSGDGLPTTIQWSGNRTPFADGEKITISGVTSHTENGTTTEQSYNGTFYIRSSSTQNGYVYQLFLDQAGLQPWDTSTYWPVNLNTGTITWSHGQYLDALGYGDGHFYVGNDDEQIFKSEISGSPGNYTVTWTKVDDKLNTLMYWNDFAYYGAFGSGGLKRINNGLSEVNIPVADGSVIVNVNDAKEWQFKPNGELVFPDGTIQATALKDMNRSWATFIGDGFNDNSTEGDFTSNIRFGCVYAMPDGSVMIGGRWRHGDSALIYHYDKNGRELWRWMDTWSGSNGSSNSNVMSITYDDVNQRLVVAIRGTWSYNNANVASTRIYKFKNEPNNFGKFNYWYIVDSYADSINVRENDQNNEATVYHVFTHNGHIISLGETYGEGNFIGFSGSAGSGSGVGILRIPRAGTAWNGEYVNSSDGGWQIRYNGNTYDLYTSSLGRYQTPAYTTNNAGQGAVFEVYVDYKTTTYSVNQLAGTTGFVDGDTITIVGSQLGGIDSGLIQGAIASGVNGQSLQLLFATDTYTTMYALLTDGRTWTVTGGVLGAGVTVSDVVDVGNNLIRVTLINGDLTGFSPADSYTFTAPGNDLTFSVTTDGMGGITSFVNVTGTPDLTNVMINTLAGWADGIDHSTSGYTYELIKVLNTEGFIINDADGWNLKQSTSGWGRLQAGLWSSADQHYYIGGESWVNNVSYNDYSLTKLDSAGNRVWSKTFSDTDTNVQGMVDSGTSIWTVDLFGQICEFDYNGTLLYQSALDSSYQNLYYNYGSTNIAYVDGYIYVGGKINVNWANNHFRVEKINATTKEVVWCRHIRNHSVNYLNSDNNYQKHMDANHEGVFITGYSYAGGDDDRMVGFLIKLDLDNPPGGNVDFYDNRLFGSQWQIFDHWDGDVLSEKRILTSHTTANRTHDLWQTSSVVMNGGEGTSSVFPRFPSVYSNLDSQGFNFNDNTGEIHHNPAYVPKIQPDFGNNGNQYTLQLSDAGKFIRTMPNNTSNVTVNVPSESMVNFPIGTVITLINMFDYNNNSNYMYINTQGDGANNYDGFDSPKIYLAGYNGNHSPSWGLKGRGTATLMKVGRDEWLLTGNCDNTW